MKCARSTQIVEPTNVLGLINGCLFFVVFLFSCVNFVCFYVCFFCVIYFFFCLIYFFIFYLQHRPYVTFNTRIKGAFCDIIDVFVSFCFCCVFVNFMQQSVNFQSHFTQWFVLHREKFCACTCCI